MNRTSAGALLAIVALFVSACGGGGSSPPPPPPPPPPPSGQLQVVHASADAPAVNVQINGATGPGLSALQFGAATPATQRNTGTASMTVNALLPDGTQTPVVSASAVNIAANTSYTAIVAGSTARTLSGGANPLQLFVLERPSAATISGVRIRALHGAPSAPAVDVYVTAPGAPLDSVSPANFSFGGALDLGTIPAEIYRIRVTLAGTTTIVFNSGPIGLPQGGDLTLVAVDNTGPGGSPIALLVVAADGTVTPVRDGGAAALAGLTAVHSANAPAVCVVADNEATPAVERTLWFAGLAPRGVVYRAVGPGKFLVGLEAFGPSCAGTSVVTIEAPLVLDPGAEVTSIIVGALANDSLELLVTGDLRRVATEARFRVLHGGALTSPVDVYVVSPGTNIADPNVQPRDSGLTFRETTGLLALMPGTYDVILTLAGNTTPLVTLPGVVFAPGDVRSAVATDPASGETLPGVILINHVALTSP
jgi:hypothetical protein